MLSFATFGMPLQHCLSTLEELRLNLTKQKLMLDFGYSQKNKLSWKCYILAAAHWPSGCAR